MSSERKNSSLVCKDCVDLLQTVLGKQKLQKEALAVLQKPEKLLSTQLKVKMDSGEQKEFAAYRIQYNTARGPAKGGIRFHPQVNAEEVMLLSFLMSLKCAVIGIPYGGGKGGVQCNPKELSEKELEGISRAWVRAFKEHIGPDKDVPAPDVNTGGQEMAWMLDEYEKLEGKHSPAAFTGKPIELGGSLGREYSTSLGGVFALEKILEKSGSGKALKGKTIAVQGFGNVGMHLARLLHERGWKVVAVSNSEGGVYDESGKGFDIPKIITNYEKDRLEKVGKGNGVRKISNEELLELPVEVLAPCALEKQINENNAGAIKAKVVLEMANAPTTPQADGLLFKRGTVVIPDILANAGGVAVSYFEWVQNRQGYYWKEMEVNDKLEEKFEEAVEAVLAKTEKGKHSLREACYSLAVDAIMEAENLRGRV